METIIETTAAAAETTAAAGGSLGNLNFNPMAFVQNLGYNDNGMIGIFIVIGIIILATVAMNKTFSGKK